MAIVLILPFTNPSILDEIIAEQDAYYGKTTPEIEETQHPEESAEGS